jgi:hypothetical protein
MAVALTISLLIVSLPLSCCIGGEGHSIQAITEKFEKALSSYESANSLYVKGKYGDSKNEYINSVTMFKEVNSAYDSFSKGNVSSLEKHIAENLAVASLQYAKASAYKRDGCDMALKGDKENEVLFILTGDEHEITGRHLYEASKLMMLEMQ